MYLDFNRVGIYETERGLFHNGQPLLYTMMFNYIERKVWKTADNVNGEIVHGYDIMFRTIDGYSGIAFIDSDSSEIGWNVHMWISPYHAGKMYRLPDGSYFISGINGRYDHFGNIMET